MHGGFIGLRDNDTIDWVWVKPVSNNHASADWRYPGCILWVKNRDSHFVDPESLCLGSAPDTDRDVQKSRRDSH